MNVLSKCACTCTLGTRRQDAGITIRYSVTALVDSIRFRLYTRYPLTAGLPVPRLVLAVRTRNVKTLGINDFILENFLCETAFNL